MSSIMRDMYRGRVHPAEESEGLPEAYEEALHALNQKQQAYLSGLNETERAVCMAIWEEMTAVSTMEEEAAYVRGMRMGAKLALELLKE